MRYNNPYMNLVMTPPAQESVYYPKGSEQSGMKLIKESGLGEVAMGGGGETIWGMSVSTVAISAIVISALAFMALCVVSMSRR